MTATIMPLSDLGTRWSRHNRQHSRPTFGSCGSSASIWREFLIRKGLFIENSHVEELLSLPAPSSEDHSDTIGVSWLSAKIMRRHRSQDRFPTALPSLPFNGSIIRSAC